MRKFLKILLGLAGLVLVLFVVLVITVTVVFDPNDYRGYLVDAVQDATGRPFELDGELGLEVFPCCSVALGPARLGNPEGFADEHFARIGAASASLELWPLIVDREVRIGTVTLQGIDVTLVRLADGRVNWELGGATAGGAEPGAPDGAAPALQVSGIEIAGARLRYRDEQTGAVYSVSDLALGTGRIDYAGERLTIRRPTVAAVVSGADIPGGEAELEVAAQDVDLSLGDTPSAAVTALEATAVVLGSRLTVSGAGRLAGDAGEAAGTLTLGETAPRDLLAALTATPYRPADDDALTRLSARAGWRLAGTTVLVEDLELRLDDSRLTGSASARELGAGPAQIALAVDAVDVARYLPAAPHAGDGTAAALLLQNIALQADGDLERIAFTLSADVQDGRVTVDGAGAPSADPPALAGTMTVAELSPRRLLTALDAAPATADPAVLTSFSGKAAWTASADAATLREMRWRLDDTEITGEAGITDFGTGAVRFDVALDRLNVDAYLPPDEAAPAGSPGEPAEEATEIPVELIRGLILDGRLRARELVMLDMTLTNVLAEVRAADGVLRVDPLTADLYGGQYLGQVVVDATGAEAVLTLDQTLAAVQVGELVQSLFASDLLDGSLSLELHGRGLGNTPADLLRGLAADLSVDLSDGVYRGTDVLHELRRARALLKNEAAPAAPAAKQTPLRALSASGRLVDGVLQTNRLSADAAGLALEGSGGIDLLELALDYQLVARLPQATAAEAKLGDLAGLAIPLAIAGPLTAPRVAVDLKELVTGNLRSALEQRARDALLERLGPDAPAAGEADAPPAADAPASTDGAASAEPAREPSAKDLLKRGLRDLLKPPPKDDRR